MNREEIIKRAVTEVVNCYGETRKTRENSIIFSNGWFASIVENIQYPERNAKYSVAMCDYNGYFDWSILNQYGADKGCFYCNSEDEICKALAIIESI